jgi:methyl-accepting chemotaxis protein
MNNLRLSVRIVILVSFALALAGGMTAYLLNAIQNVSAVYSGLLTHEVAQAEQAREMQLTFKKQVQAWKDILLRGHNREDRAKYGDEFAHQESEVKRLAEVLRTSLANSETKAALNQFVAAHEALGGKYREGLALFDRSRGRRYGEVDHMLKGQDRPPTNLVDQIVGGLNKQVREKAAAEQAAMGREQKRLVIVALAGFSIILAGAILFARSTARRLQRTVARLRDLAEGEGDLTARLPAENTDEVGDLGRFFNAFVEKLESTLAQISANSIRLASASEEISASATQQSTGAEAQKDKTTQVATAMQQMSSTVVQISDNSTKAADAAKKASETAREGGKIVDETLRKMREIAASVGETAKKVNGLGSRSDQIGQIIGVIDDIADQTNLLALNAAIEAARAGEQGRGFAVVADEVRKLAERTSKATKEIATMIQSIQQETKSAVVAMESGTKQVESGVETTMHAGMSLSQIIQSAEQVGEMVTHIATAATQQSSATDEINTNIEHIARITAESSGGAQQSAKACEDLANLALDLQKLVGRFKLNESAGRNVAEEDMRVSERKKAHPEKYVPARVHAVLKSPGSIRAA